MWSPDTYWLDVAVVTVIFAIGSPLFGHFEEHKPKSKRLLKVVAFVGLVVGFSAPGARWLAYSIIGRMLFGAAVVHVYWLPRHGVNSWTGDPKDQYDEFSVPHWISLPEPLRLSRASTVCGSEREE